MSADLCKLAQAAIGAVQKGEISFIKAEKQLNALAKTSGGKFLPNSQGCLKRLRQAVNDDNDVATRCKELSTALQGDYGRTEKVAVATK